MERPQDHKERPRDHTEREGKGNQSLIFIGRTDVELKLQSFGYLMGRVDSLKKTLMLGNMQGKKRRGQQWVRLFDSITDLMDMNLKKTARGIEGQ